MQQQQQGERGGEATARTWDRLAQLYKAVSTNLTDQHAAEALRLLRLDGSERVVLDIACGLGAFTLVAANELKRLREKQPAGGAGSFKVLATDFSQPMVHACQKEVEAQGLADVIECRQMDAQRLAGIADGSVDVIGCVFGAMFFPDVVAAFREMHRVLRPGGRAAIVVWKSIETMSLMKKVSDRLQGQYDAAAERFYKLADPDVMRSRLEEAGFRGVPSLTTYEADWSGFSGDDPDVINFFVDNPVTSLCFPQGKKEEAVAVVRQVMQEEGMELKGSKWDNSSLIAVVQK